MDNIFEKNAAEEPSKGATPQEPSKGATQEPLPPKKQEGTFENLQSQKDKLEKQLAERQAAWEKERQELLEKTGSTQSQLQNLLQEVEKLKNPPEKPIELKPPAQPQITFEDDPIAWFNYQNELQIYKDKKYELDTRSLRDEVTNVKTQLQKDAEAKKQQQQYEMWKTELIGEFEKEGLSHNEAVDCFNQYSRQDSVTPKNIVSLFRLGKGSEPVKTNEKERFPLPGGRGGSAEPNQNDAEGMINAMGQNKFASIFNKG